MAITIQERWVNVETVDGVSDADDNAEVFYIVHTDDDEEETDVRAFCKNINNIPVDYDGLGLTRLSIKRIEELAESWLVTASYASRSLSWTLPKLTHGEFRWRIRTSSAGTQKATQCVDLVTEQTSNAAFAFNGTPLEKTMGITKSTDGGLEIAGVDRPVGIVLVDCQAVVAADQVTSGYLVDTATLAAQNAINDTAWEGFGPETLKIVSFDARPRSADDGDDPDWDLNFVFHYEPSLTGLVIGDLTAVDKKGHDRLDVLYSRAKIGSLTVAKPVRAAVQQEFPKTSFTTNLLLPPPV